MRVVLFLMLALPLAAGEPVVGFATYLGGSSADAARAVTVDAAGNVLVTGFTASRDFPVRNAAFPSCADPCADAFIAKYDSAGRLVYATYFGTPRDDAGNAIVTDAQGNAYVGGQYSEESAFVLKLDPRGRLVGAASLTGSPMTTVKAITLDPDGNVIVTGTTTSSSLYTLKPLQPAPGGSSPASDAFVAKFDRNLTLVFSTYLGGSANDRGESIGTDAAGNIYVAGTTGSTNFPTLDAWQGAFGGGATDLFLTKIAPDGQRILYSTFVGGPADETGARVRLSPSGRTVLAGGGSLFAFGPRGGAPLWTAPVGAAVELAVDVAGTATVVSSGAVEIDASGKRVADYALPGAPASGVWAGAGRSLALAGTGAIAPVNAAQPNPAGSDDAYVMQMAASPGCATAVSLNGAGFRGPDAAPESIVSVFGCELAGAVESAKSLPLSRSMAGVEARLTDSQGGTTSAEIYAVSPFQVNLVIPGGVAAGGATLELFNNALRTAAAYVRVEAVAPALFSVAANGSGVASALALRVTADGRRLPLPVFVCAANACSAVPLDLGQEGDRLYVSLFGTGLRGRSSAAAVEARAAGQSLTVLGVAAQSEYPGLDQVNVEIPRTLAGSGLVNVVLTVDGVHTNPVQIQIR